MSGRSKKGFRRSGRVALFVTCLADIFRPEVGFSALRLLSQAGFRVEVPEQRCCGQPNLNGGDRDGAREMARAFYQRFRNFDYIVVPSGSCTATICRDYADLFAEGSAEHDLALRIARRTWELTEFLTRFTEGLEFPEQPEQSVTYHDGCSGLRQLGIRKAPRKLLEQLPGCELKELSNPDVCCGFGGTFCASYSDISTRMTDDKIADIRDTGADCVVGGDLGCLLNIEGRLHREGIPVRVRHIAELLAGAESPDD